MARFGNSRAIYGDSCDMLWIHTLLTRGVEVIHHLHCEQSRTTGEPEMPVSSSTAVALVCRIIVA